MRRVQGVTAKSSHAVDYGISGSEDVGVVSCFHLVWVVSCGVGPRLAFRCIKRKKRKTDLPLLSAGNVFFRKRQIGEKKIYFMVILCRGVIVNR